MSITNQQNTFMVIAPFIANFKNSRAREIVHEKREQYEVLSMAQRLVEDNPPQAQDYLDNGGEHKDWKAVRDEHSRRLRLIIELKVALLSEISAIEEMQSGIIYDPLNKDANKLDTLGGELD